MQPLQTQFLKIIHILGKGIELFIVMRHYYLHGLINPNHPPESSWSQWSPEEEDLRLMLAVPLSPSPSPSETPESGSSSPRARCSSWQLSGTPSSNLKSKPDLASLLIVVGLVRCFEIALFSTVYEMLPCRLLLVPRNEMVNSQELSFIYLVKEVYHLDWKISLFLRIFHIEPQLVVARYTLLTFTWHIPGC